MGNMQPNTPFRSKITKSFDGCNFLFIVLLLINFNYEYKLVYMRIQLLFFTKLQYKLIKYQKNESIFIKFIHFSFNIRTLI